MSRGSVLSGRRARVLVVLAFAVCLLASVLLPLNGEYQDGLARERASAGDPVVLNVALVNEDRGVEAGGEQVNLGRAYVRQIESDTSAQWRVVSRGVGESGLVQGSYHVLVLIPSEFSEKLLDLDAEDPGAIGITYQVNGNGNARVEAVADTRGREIVGQLNGQLVDMYVASILGNLRQAQDNVRVVVDAEAEHVEVLVEEVDPAARAIGGGLEVLTEVSDGSVTSQLGLVDALDVLADGTHGSAEAATEHDVSLIALLSAREEGTLTYARFLETLLEVDARLLGDEVQRLYDELVDTSDGLRGQLDATSGTRNHTAAVGTVHDLTSESERAVDDRDQALDDLGPAAVLATHGPPVRAALDLAPDGPLTLADVLDLAGRAGSDTTSPAGFVPALADAVASRIAVLPFRDHAAVDKAVADGIFEHAGGGLAELAGQVADDLATVMTWDGHADVPPSPDGVVGADLEAIIAELLDAQAAPEAAPEPAPEPEPGPGSEPDPDPLPGSPRSDPVPHAARYASEIARVAGAYAHAADLVRLAHACASTCGLHPGTDVTSAVDALVTTSVEEQIASERLHLREARALVGRMLAAAEELAGTHLVLQATQSHLEANVAEHLASLADLRGGMAQARTDERATARSLAGSDGLTRGIAGEARSLVASSEALAASSRSGAEYARRVTDLMHGLRADVDRLVGDAADLDERSELLTQALVGQVEDSQAFADSFGGVLANAHSAGVLNERLLRFLVDPVEPQARDSVVSTDVTRPFPWVLIVSALCFVTGYLLAGLTDGRQHRSAFARRGALWLGPRARALATVAVAGALLGAGLGWASAADLGVPRSAQVVWSAAVVLSCVGLTVLAHWAVRQLRAVGVGLCLLLLVGYVFVSDAVGTGVTSGVSGVVAAVNPLSRTESALSAVLGSGPAGLSVLGPLLVVAAVAAVLDLLVQDDLGRLVPRRRTAVAA